MIKNDRELEIVREQIQRLVSALASLKRTTGHAGEKQFYVLAEGCVDQIAELQGDVDDYITAEKSENFESSGDRTTQPLRPQGAA